MSSDKILEVMRSARAEIAASPRISIPFVEPYQTGAEAGRLQDALRSVRLAGDNALTRHCQNWLRDKLGARCALLTPSGTAALEMAAILAGLTTGDEVIMPSYTFSSTANAVVLRGAVPVFIDIRADTLNIDETLIEAAITPRTKAIFVVHYAGIPCEMDTIRAIAAKYKLLVLEDAAQALLSSYKGRAAGRLGDMAAFSFHETKNIQCGEGGAFVCDDEVLAHRAEIVREKGTNRSAFFRGEVDKYTWIDVGSSYLPSELSAAMLAAQLQRAEAITAERLTIWDKYQSAFAGLEQHGRLRRPIVPDDCRHNAHIYYLLMPDLTARLSFMQALRERGVQTTSHYVPLHSAPAGRKYGRAAESFTVTDQVSDGLVRLPLWCGMGDAKVAQVVESVVETLYR